MATKLRLKPEDYEKIDRIVGLSGEEYYSVVTHRVRGKWIRSIHVFARQPMTKELTEYENTASRIKMKGNRTEVEGSQLLAAKHLYDALISRAYDVPVGWKIYGEVDVDETGAVKSGKPLDRPEAVKTVPATIKREALRDTFGEVYSEARVAEMEGEDEEVKGDKEED
jgi:hypothetical protein